MIKGVLLLFAVIVFIGGVFYIAGDFDNVFTGEVVEDDYVPDVVLDYPLEKSVEQEYRVAVIMINAYADEIIPSEPLSNKKQEFYSPKQLGDIFFEHDWGVNSFIQESSYGKVGFSGTVVGWFNLGAQELNGSEIRDNKDYYVSLASDYLNFSEYDIFYLVGKTHGEGAQLGWRMSNSIYNSPQGSFRNKGFDYLINSLFLVDVGGPYLSGLILPTTSWAHEILHTLGVGHSISLNCGQEVISDSCVFTPYGGVYSVMGEHAYATHPDILMKEILGWVEPNQILEVADSGEYIIYPLETAEPNVKGLRISLNNSLTVYSETVGVDVNFDSIYLEYRIPEGFDKYIERLDGGDFLSSYYFGNQADRNGVIVYLGYESPEVTSSMLLDMKPETPFNLDRGIKTKGNVGKFSDSILSIGNSFYEVNNRISITPIEILEGRGIKIKVGVDVDKDVEQIFSNVKVVEDEFDFWEDQSSHNYQVDGINREGAYGLTEYDLPKACLSTGLCEKFALRLGSCTFGGGWASVDFDIEPNIDEFTLSFVFSAYTKKEEDVMDLKIDGEQIPVYNLFSIVKSCIPSPLFEVIITDASRFTEDGKITINISDAYPGICNGDLQIERLEVYYEKMDYVSPLVVSSTEVDSILEGSNLSGVDETIININEQVIEKDDEEDEEDDEGVADESIGFSSSSSTSSSSSSSSSGGGIVNSKNCEGCEFEDNCYFVGDRFDGKYCSEKLNFKDQLKRGRICAEDYECQSETCYLDRCTNPPIIHRFTEWVKDLLCTLKITC